MIQKHWKLWNYRTSCFVYPVVRRNVLSFSQCGQWYFKGGNFHLQHGLNLFFVVWPSGQRPKGRMFWPQLDALYDYQNMLSVFGFCFFWENRKNHVFAPMLFLSAFKCSAPSCSHAHGEIVENFVKETSFLKHCLFLFFVPQARHYPNNHDKTSEVHGQSNILWLNAVIRKFPKE